MSVTDYLPGDRVVYTANAGRPNRKGWLGTVVERLPEMDASTTRIQFDCLNAPTVHTNGYFERQPIEAGCYVREVPGSNVFSNSRQVEQVLEVIGNLAILKGFLGGTLKINLERLIRVAEPAVSGIEINDTGMRISLGSGQFFILDPLKQAQDLASALHAKHFSDTAPDWKVADNLPGVLSQIDNMTAGLAPSNIGDALDRRNRRIASLQMTRDNLRDTNNVIAHKNAEYLGQLDKLAAFIEAEVPGEPSRSEGAVDTAIRVMRRQEQALKAVALIARSVARTDPLRRDADAWLAEYDPTPPVTFKRGDLIVTNTGFKARIVRMYPDNREFEVMSETGRFEDVSIASCKHVE